MDQLEAYADGICALRGMLGAKRFHWERDLRISRELALQAARMPLPELLR